MCRDTKGEELGGNHRRGGVCEDTTGDGVSEETRRGGVCGEWGHKNVDVWGQ